MILSTLCYIENDGRYLMLHRTKKKDDPNEGKWIGVGGKFEENESPDECVAREVKEETGFTLTDCRFRGIVTFVSDLWETEYMHLFTASSFITADGSAITDASVRFDAELPSCSEGRLAWVEKSDVMSLRLWEGDRIFLRLLTETEEFFSLKLEYQGEDLVRASVSGKEINLR